MFEGQIFAYFASIKRWRGHFSHDSEVQYPFESCNNACDSRAFSATTPIFAQRRMKVLFSAGSCSRRSIPLLSRSRRIVYSE